MGGGKSRRQNNNHRRSQNKKPPSDFQKPSVASWEREFCKVVGAMEWDVFLQKKKDIHLHPQALKWNDIACELEAFNNAKKLFLSLKCDFSCDNVPLPDPNLYINDIDWDSKIDFDRDLDCSISVVSETEEDDGGPKIFGDPMVPESYQAIAPTGWGDNFDTPAFTFSARFGDILGED